MDKKTDVRDPDEKVVEIEMERLRAFPNHPFKVIGDSQMIELQDSIKKYGVLNPLIVRPKIEGYYEIISGHRRKYAAEKLGYKKIPVIIRMLQDDEAVVIMVDSNLQREQITPSEKAYAYKMKYDAIKKKAGRKNCSQVDHNTGKRSIDVIGELCGDSAKQVQYSFYKIPKLLFTEEYFKKISVEAKVLYGLMLDRMSLSMKNQWLDEEGRAYIYYSLDDIMEALGCSNKKAISIMKELDTDAGIGLIEKKRQGQGKPTMIYLKQFVIQDFQKCKNYTSDEKTAISEVKNLHVLKCKNDMSRSEEFTHQEVKKLHTNKTNINNTELSKSESNHIVSGNDGMGSEVEAYTELIRENLDFEILLERYPYDRELLEGIFDLILETVLCKNKTVVVASNEYPAELVRSKFLKLTSAHVQYAMDCMRTNTTKVHNIKKYLLAALFNAPSTISGYYQAEVNHDMPQFVVSGR